MKINFTLAIVVTLVILGALTAIQTYVASVDPSTIPAEFSEVWQVIVYIFTAGASTVAFTFLRNILGYVQKKLEAAPEARSAIEYEANRLGATAANYALYVYGFTAAIQTLTVGTPYAAYAATIAGAIGIVLDKVVGSIKDLKTPT